MRQEPQYFGDAVEHNRLMHEEAHRRARERNNLDPRADRMTGEERQPITVTDLNVYSEAERAPADAAHGVTLSWGGGDPRLVPQVLERNPDPPAPDGRGGALFGVDAIVNGRK